MKVNNELEIYACIDGYPDYLVTSHGRVLSLKGEKIKEIKYQINHIGYYRVFLYKNNKRKPFMVHRLVAQSFIPNNDNKPQVNHIDENKTNNHVSNLEWTTAKENINYGTRNEKVAKAVSKALSKKIMAKSTTQPKVLVFKSSRSCNNFGFNQGNVSQCCNGKKQSYKGYTWHYIEEKE